MSRIPALVVSLMVIAAPLTSPEHTPPTDVWKKGVVVIDHNLKQTTGMFVGEGLVLTAAHITKAPVWKFYGCYPFWGWSEELGVFRLTPIAIDTRADVLLLRANVRGRHIFRRFAPAQDGEDAWAVGYQFGWLSAERASVCRHASIDYYGLDTKMAPLGSGSPVLNRGGDIIGMVVSTDEYFTLFVPAAILSDFLRRHEDDQKNQERN